VVIIIVFGLLRMRRVQRNRKANLEAKRAMQANRNQVEMQRSQWATPPIQYGPAQNVPVQYPVQNTQETVTIPVATATIVQEPQNGSTPVAVAQPVDPKAPSNMSVAV